jgi:hypothetical protein
LPGNDSNRGSIWGLSVFPPLNYSKEEETEIHRRLFTLNNETRLLSTHRLYTRLIATKVHCQLIVKKGYRENVAVDNNPVVVRISIDAKAMVKVGNFFLQGQRRCCQIAVNWQNLQSKKHLKPLLWRLEMHRGFKLFTRYAEGEILICLFIAALLRPRQARNRCVLFADVG